MGSRQRPEVQTRAAAQGSEGLASVQARLPSPEGLRGLLASCCLGMCVILGSSGFFFMDFLSLKKNIFCIKIA